MLKHELQLPDGSVLTSGPGAGSAICSVTLTEQVGDGEELDPGAACAACAEIEIWAPDTGAPVAQGDEVTLFRVDTAAGTRTRAGVFLAEKPTRVSANVYRVTAYDRMTLFDKDMTAWLAQRQGEFPLGLADFAAALCEACGVTPATGALDKMPNGEYPVRAFSADGVTGRQLLQWVAQAAGCFARMTDLGELELDWYDPRQGTPVIAAPGEEKVDLALRLAGRVLRTAQEQVFRIGGEAGYYCQNSLQYEEYATAPIDKVQIRQSEADAGVVWPPDETGDNALVVSRNLLLTTDSAVSLEPVAKMLYERMASESYTPLTVTLPFREELRPGTRLDVVDPHGRVMHTLVMKRTIGGQTMTLESTGSARRDSTTAVNRQSYKDLQGKVFEVQASVDGLELTAQQDFPGDQMRDSVWKQANSGSVAGGVVVPNGRQVVLEADGTGSCGATIAVPDSVLPILPGALTEFSVTYRVVSPIEILDASVTGAYITAFVQYADGENSQVERGTLVRIAEYDAPAAQTDWITVSTQMQIPDRDIEKVYLFANIQSGTGTLEIRDPETQILSAKVTRLSLDAGGVELSSARIAFTGMVNFDDLAGEGRTTINGANVTTGVISSRNGALTIDLDNAALVAGSGADLRAGSQDSYTKFVSVGFNSYSGGQLRSGIENNWKWFNRSLTAIFSTSGLTGVGYKNAAGTLSVGYAYDPYSDIQSGYVNYLSGNTYCSGNSNANVLRCRHQLYLENSVGGANDGQIQAYDDAVTVYSTNFRCVGSISCDGAKNRIVNTEEYGARALNAMESAAALFCDSGGGQLDENGLCLLVIHPVLDACLDPYARPRWLVSGAAPGFWVEKQGRMALVHGPAGAEFDWMLMAPQKGYADCYADPAPDAGPVPDAVGQGELDEVCALARRCDQWGDALTNAVAEAWNDMEGTEVPA